MLCCQSERQEVAGSQERLDLVVSEAKRLMKNYDADDTSKINADIQLITAHWQQLQDRWNSFFATLLIGITPVQVI